MTRVPNAPAGVDVSTPAPARIYDYMLRGSNHFPSDVEAAGKILSAVPEIRDCAWSNRGFHQRAAKWIAEHGSLEGVIAAAPQIEHNFRAKLESSLSHGWQCR